MKLVLLVTLVAATLAGDTFKLTVSTKDLHNANTDGACYASVIDYTGQIVDLGKMDDPKRDDYERGKTDVFTFKTDVTFKKIGCLLIRAASSDFWIPDKVAISSNTDVGFRGTNFASKRISTDTSTAGDKGHLAMLWCAPPYPKKE